MNINDQKFNTEDFKFIKKLTEHTLKFWAECHRDIPGFPWNAFDGTEDEEDINEVRRRLNDSEKETLKKLKETGIDTFNVENTEELTIYKGKGNED